MGTIKIIVFSDTHRSRPVLKHTRKILQTEKPDLLLHAGDNYQDFLWLKNASDIPGHGVCGNCDYDVSDCKNELIFEYQNVKFLLCHGHQYNVKFTLNNLYYRAQELDVNVAVFGHTHMAAIEQETGITLFNPGSLYQPRGNDIYSYGIIHVDNGKINCELKEVDPAVYYAISGLFAKMFF